MRKQFVTTIERLMSQDDRIVVLLGDIGVFGFRNVFQKYPSRIFNIGICEQAMTGLAAGLAKEGLIPVIHSIAPFVVERCLEQIKIDLGYQRAGVKIVSVGASYDYAALGPTHHCPGDIMALSTVPGMEIVVPGSADEFDRLFDSARDNGQSTYFRLSETANSHGYPVEFGRACVVRRGGAATVLAVGPMLTEVLAAVEGLDVSVLYYTSLSPFDRETLSSTCLNGKLLVVEPFYEGSLSYEVQKALEGRLSRVVSVGVPRRFIRNYGKAREHDVACGLTSPSIRARLEALINE